MLGNKPGALPAAAILLQVSAFATCKGADSFFHFKPLHQIPISPNCVLVSPYFDRSSSHTVALSLHNNSNMLIHVFVDVSQKACRDDAHATCSDASEVDILVTF